MKAKNFQEMNETVARRIEWKIQQMKGYECELSIVLQEPLDSLMRRLIIETVEHCHRRVKDITPASGYAVIIKLESGFSR